MSDQAENINQVLLVALDAYGDRPCFLVRHGLRYRPIDYRTVKETGFRLAAFFRRQGVETGDRVALVAENSPEWMASFIACSLVGAVAVPLRPTLPAEELGFSLRDSGATLAVVETAETLHKLESLARDPPSLAAVLLLHGSVRSRFATTSLEHLAETCGEERVALRVRAEAVADDAMIAIHYTGRETGRAKGAVFDHRRRLDAMRLVADWLDFDRDDLAFTVLPWSFSPSHLFTLRCLLSGVATVLIESRDKLFEGLRQTSPTLGLVTPYGFERLYSRVMADLRALPRSRRDVFQWALSVGKEYRSAGSTAGRDLREGYAGADRTFFSQIRAGLGGRLRELYSVGAPLPQHLAEFAEIIGLAPRSLYGLTEAGGFPAIGRLGGPCHGSCGQVAKGFQIRIADDGEVLVRGRSVMSGYWRLPEESRERLDSDGWLHTDDLGRFDGQGDLHLIGHKQSLFLLSTGRTVDPTTIEYALTASPLVAQTVIIAEGRPYVTALIVPDLKAIASGGNGNGAIVDDSHLQQQMHNLVERVNDSLDSWERIERFTLIAEPFAASEMSDSMVPNRQAVAERFAKEIEAMFPAVVAELAHREVDQITLEPEQLRELLEKQDILDAWLEDAGIGFLFDLARSKQIHAPSMVHICETVAAIAQMQNEEEPLSTALIVGDPARIARVLPTSEIQLHRYDHIRRMRHVVITLAEMVDGLVLGYAVDQHGYVRGIHKLEVALDADTHDLLGPQFRHHAAISRRCEAMVFFVPNGGRQVRIFADGHLIGRYANGIWSSERVDRVDQALTHLAEEEKHERGLVRRLLRCAFRMSEANLGAIFTVGDADLILQHSDPPAISAFATIGSAAVHELSDSELINFAKQDGATVIDASGRFRGSKVLLRPAAETQAEIGPGMGARHSSAAKMSAEAGCLAIVVSQDGPITIYVRGKRIFSL